MSAQKPVIALIAAMARNRVIGRNNELPWRLPDELKHFKAVTMGHPILMGRKTWESLGRPLPGRRHLVISRQTGLKLEGAEVFGSLEAAIAACTKVPKVFVIGGGQLYAKAIDLADELHLTEIHADIAGDAWFPDFNRAAFREERREPHPADERHPWPFDFVHYRRNPTYCSAAK